jgi:GPH family glycoside/pentoside/hexuronide:cation symporter
MVETHGKLPLSVKLGYSFPSAAYFIAYNALALYLIWFFTEAVGLPPAFAGIIASIGILWDAITDPLIGMWSDNRDPAKGRRRPFMLAVAIPFGLSVWLMFTNFGFGPIMTKVYYIVIAMVYYTCMTALDVPYTALGAEMTTDYDERSSLANFRNMSSQVANFSTALVFFILPVFIEKFGSASAGWSVTMAIYGAAATAAILIGWKATAGYNITELTSHERITYKDYFAVLKNRPFRNVVYMYSLSVLAMGVVNTVLIYFLFFVGGLAESQVPIALMIVFGCSFLFAPLINVISQRMSKKVAWVFAMGSWALTLSLFPLVIIPGMANPVWGAYAMLFLSAIGCTAQYQVAWSMIPDCVELDEFKTGHRREGLYYATATFIQKIATALAMAIAGYLLGKIGYTDASQMTPEIANGIKYLFALGSSIPLAMSALVVVFTPMSRECHACLLQAIALKEKGKAYSVDGFRSLFNNEAEAGKYSD